MILQEIKNIKSDKKELKKFGITIGIAITAIAFLFSSIISTPFFILIFLACSFLFAGIVIPGVLYYLHKIWMIIAIMLSFISTRVILTLLYYLIVTPIGLMMRIGGKDFLDEKIEKKKSSYWIKRIPKEYLSEDSEKQF